MKRPSARQANYALLVFLLVALTAISTAVIVHATADRPKPAAGTTLPAAAPTAASVPTPPPASALPTTPAAPPATPPSSLPRNALPSAPTPRLGAEIVLLQETIHVLQAAVESLKCEVKQPLLDEIKAVREKVEGLARMESETAPRIETTMNVVADIRNEMEKIRSALAGLREAKPASADPGARLVSEATDGPQVSMRMGDQPLQFILDPVQWTLVVFFDTDTGSTYHRHPNWIEMEYQMPDGNHVLLRNENQESTPKDAAGKEQPVMLSRHVRFRGPKGDRLTVWLKP